MIRKPIKTGTRIILGLLAIVVLLGGYTAISHRQHLRNPDDTTIPSWSQLQDGVKQMITPHRRTGERMLVQDVKASATRYFAGLSLGVVGAMILGLSMGCFSPVEAFCRPVLSLVAQIPATAALAVFFVMVGTGQEMYVAMIVFGILPILAQTVHLAVKEFPEELQFKGYTLGASHAEVIFCLIVRQVLPKLFDTLRLVIGPALVYLIAAESLLGDVGFGYRIRLLSKLQNMSVVYPYLALLAAFGFTTDYFIRRLQATLCPWYEADPRPPGLPHSANSGAASDPGGRVPNPELMAASPTSSTTPPAASPAHPEPASVALECCQISHRFGAKLVLFQVDFHVPRGQFLSLVGPSGCGKSTLLRAIVGTHLPDQGEVRIRPLGNASHRPVTCPGRDRGIVYQHYSLFPFLTALENVAIGLKLDQTTIPYRVFRWPAWRKLRRQHLAEATAMLERVKLGDALHLYPHEMSGGMRQRVALAQALIMKPEVILLDEPFGALDESTREDLQRLLLGLHAENANATREGRTPPVTLLIVTHELNEALLVGDRVIGLSQYWDWHSERLPLPPGATVVYDQPSPIFKPENARELEAFALQREEIRRVVFDPASRYPRTQFANCTPPKPLTPNP